MPRLHRPSCLLRLILAIFLIASCDRALAGKFNQVLSVGAAAPVWKDLGGVDGKRHSLSDIKAKFIVFVFIANHCPVAAANEARFKQLAADYREKDVELIAISVSRFPSDRLEKMKERAEDAKFNFLYLHDPTQATGHQYGATATPQVFVLNADRQVSYMGAWDDSGRDASKVQRHYTREALDALLQGQPIEIRETRPVGCEIEYVTVTTSKP
jgi:peroxiredoxin